MYAVRASSIMVLAACLVFGCDEISSRDDPRQRASFVDADPSGSCTGEVVSCRERTLDACNGYGCAVQEACHPEEVHRCLSHDEDACRVDADCLWSSRDGRCRTYSFSPCWDEPTEAECLEFDFLDCAWGDVCEGNALACRLIEDREVCKVQPGCEWEWD
jgi:hypothetical protein